MDAVSGDGRGTTERVLTLLGLLQRRRVWTGPELADRLGVTPRTVRRDVERLRALGYRVQAGQGVGGGYRLGAGQDLPPLLLDDQEAIATVVALLVGAGDAVTGTGDAALRALTKLDRMLPARLRDEVRALSGAVESFGGGRTPVDPQVLMTLAGACRDGVEAGFGYRSGSGVRRRRVEPYRLVASDRRWYLLAYDLDRDGWRSFRVDRMTDVSARTWRFRPRAAPDAAAYVQEGVASRVYPHRARFLVHAPADTVRAQVPASAAVVRRRGEDRCEVLSGGGSLDFVLMHVLLLGHAFEVIDPPELGRRCRVLAERLLAAGAVPGAPDGPDAPEGPDGPDGPDAPEGPDGPDGPDAPEGPDGPDGAEGTDAEEPSAAVADAEEA
ncbi:YafY family protein [Planomonospora sp. ID82291]|uniref:helix-turn-helix transcriptional regulator n=1 Tax=Planomonospora sp. ID82291 TaxID=2738136 RepID=UPI0018C41857|nr:WYL domain-containing protein [Planomonospora sp. ID82291]MBG0818537.1 WYL domain-containing protein [Planomonospora sp. ID82291]